MDWKKTIASLAPTVASALLGPLGGAAVSALGGVFGLDNATEDTLKQAIIGGNMPPEAIAKLKELELKYQADEQERGFKYAELAFKDRDSARQANVSGGTQKMLFVMSVILLCITLGAELLVLFNGYPDDKIPEMVVGRILGLMDAVAMMVMSYWYGTTSGSHQKSELLANSTPSR